MWFRLKGRTWKKGLYKEKKEKTRKEAKKYGKKQKILPSSHTMSQQGSVGPSVSGAGGPERQVVDLAMLVVATGSVMEIGRPS